MKLFCEEADMILSVSIPCNCFRSLKISPTFLTVSWGEYVNVLYLFLTQNKKFQFADQKLIGIGHSMGAISLFVHKFPCATSLLAGFFMALRLICPPDA